MIKSPANPNYCATVVKLGPIYPLAGCHSIFGTRIFGNQVLVGKDAREGALGIFFPTETALSQFYLHYNNLFRDPTLNFDQTQKGYFEAHGRVRAIKFRGHQSGGFWMPLSSLSHYSNRDPALNPDFIEGVSFDTLNDVPVCFKYVAARNPQPTKCRERRKARPEDRIVEGQFHFHIDTAHLRRNLDAIQPEDIIWISDKWHGCSAIYGNLLSTRKLKWYERMLKAFGVKVSDRAYEFVWASRSVVKGVGDEARASVNHYYGSDVWAAVAEQYKLREKLPKGCTIYGEIVGYTPSGAEIQKGYTYSANPKESILKVYRITQTNEDGVVTEMTWPQIREFCERLNLPTVMTLYYGLAFDLLPGPCAGMTYGMFKEAFVQELEKRWVHDQECVWNPGKPAEGIVVRRERLFACESYKMKNFRFLEYETKLLDQNISDIETEQVYEQ